MYITTHRHLLLPCSLMMLEFAKFQAIKNKAQVNAYYKKSPTFPASAITKTTKVRGANINVFTIINNYIMIFRYKHKSHSANFILTLRRDFLV